jgi:hypothetical protein
MSTCLFSPRRVNSSTHNQHINPDHLLHVAQVRIHNLILSSSSSHHAYIIRTIRAPRTPCTSSPRLHLAILHIHTAPATRPKRSPNSVCLPRSASRRRHPTSCHNAYTQGTDADSAYQLIHDELTLDGSPLLNLASFVHTWMPPQADKLMVETMSKNLIDQDEYPMTRKLQLPWLESRLNISVHRGNPHPLHFHACRSMECATCCSRHWHRDDGVL